MRLCFTSLNFLVLLLQFSESFQFNLLASVWSVNDEHFVFLLRLLRVGLKLCTSHLDGQNRSFLAISGLVRKVKALIDSCKLGPFFLGVLPAQASFDIQDVELDFCLACGMLPYEGVSPHQLNVIFSRETDI